MKVEFETARGETVTAEAQPGDNLLRVAQAITRSRPDGFRNINE